MSIVLNFVLCVVNGSSLQMHINNYNLKTQLPIKYANDQLNLSIWKV